MKIGPVIILCVVCLLAGAVGGFIFRTVTPDAEFARLEKENEKLLTDLKNAAHDVLDTSDKIVTIHKAMDETIKNTEEGLAKLKKGTQTVQAKMLVLITMVENLQTDNKKLQNALLEVKKTLEQQSAGMSDKLGLPVTSPVP